MQDRYRLYLDANFFIEALEGESDVSETCWELLTMGEKRPGLLVTSLLTLSEVLVLPLRTGPGEVQRQTLPDDEFRASGGKWLHGKPLAADYAALIADSPRLAVWQMDRQIMIAAAQIRSQWHAGKLPDAIHLATAQLALCTHMISADKKLCGVAGERYGLVSTPPSGIGSILSEIEAST